MVDSFYINKIIRKLKNGIDCEIKRKNYNNALALISNCADLIYQTNLYYVDSYLENKLKFIANELKISIPITNNENKLVFYDGFGLNERGLSQIYVKALCKIKDVIYVTYEDRKNEIPDILKILNEHNCNVFFIKRERKSYIEQINELIHVICKQKPSDFFFYSFPNDVVGVVCLNLINNKVKRYQINLTDHAFWLGAQSIDKCIEFRDYGASISKKYRKLDPASLVKIPFYPIINKDVEFQGFPFEVNVNQKIVFSGGALYKTFGGNGKYYQIIDYILKNYKDVIFWYAGNGDNRKLMQLKKKYPERLYHTSERTDLFQVLQHCRFYLSTYPISGGLMYQYSALAGIVPVSLKYDEDADGYLLNQDNLNINFDNLNDLYIEIDKLLMYDNYFNNRKLVMQHSVISEYEFFNYVKLLFENKSVLKINYLELDTTDFREEYLRRLNKLDVDSLILNKNAIKTSIKYVPVNLLKGIFKKFTHIISTKIQKK